MASDSERDNRWPWENRAGLLVQEVEDRLLRACKTLRALPDRERGFQTVRGCWPEMLREVEEAYGYTEERMPRFRPSPSDVSDCLTALAWARVVTAKDFRFIWWRSFGASFRQIGMRIGKSDERARQLYRDVILRIWFEVRPADLT